MRILAPKTEDALAETVDEAAAKHTTLRVAGGGTRSIGNPVQAEAALQTGSLSGITLYEPGALTIVARAGTRLCDLEETLAGENQQLPFEPPDYAGLFEAKGKSTIGGVVATGASGPRRLQAGGARDSLIGVRFVSGEGKIIKNGGRVMKNVTGYDLVKLMCGSHGTLGVLTEVSFKVLPKPELTGAVLVEGLDDAAAISLLARAVSSPFDVSGAAHATRGLDGEPVTMIRVEGFEQSIRYRTEKLKELLAPHLPPKAQLVVELDRKRTAAGWRWVRNLEAFHGTSGAVWRISVKPGDGPRVAAAIRDSLSVETLYDWAGGLLWVLLEEGQKGAEPVIRGAVNKVGGHATLFRHDPDVSGAVEAFHPEHPRIAQISADIRRKFDPAGILNPGLMASTGQGG